MSENGSAIYFLILFFSGVDAKFKCTWDCCPATSGLQTVLCDDNVMNS